MYREKKNKIFFWKKEMQTHRTFVFWKMSNVRNYTLSFSTRSLDWKLSSKISRLADELNDRSTALAIAPAAMATKADLSTLFMQSIVTVTLIRQSKERGGNIDFEMGFRILKQNSWFLVNEEVQSCNVLTWCFTTSYHLGSTKL